MASNYQNGYNRNGNTYQNNRYISKPKPKQYNPFTDPKNDSRFNQTLAECNHYYQNNPSISKPKPDNRYISKAKPKPYNPFTDPKNDMRSNQALAECYRLNQIQPNNQQHIANNPYLNDPNLVTAMHQFSPLKNNQYEQRHAIQRNGTNPNHSHNHNNHNNHNYHNNYNRYNIINNNHHLNYNYTAKSQSQLQQKRTTEKTKETLDPETSNSNHHRSHSRIIIASDNPYHPSIYYKEKESEQQRAKDLVSKYRVNEIKRDAVETEFAQFISSLPDMAMINEEDTKNQYRLKMSSSHSPNSSQGNIKIGVDDMIPGQIQINASNFHELRVKDTVWIRNDVGDWAVYTVIKMEKTHVDHSSFTYIATFKNGDKQKVIWQQQCGDFVMAKFKKEDKRHNNNANNYVLNNIFKINGGGLNGIFVLKEYNPENGMANVKDVSTGNMLNVNLNDVQHTII